MELPVFPSGLFSYWLGNRLRASCIATAKGDQPTVQLLARSLHGQGDQCTAANNAWQEIESYRAFADAAQDGDAAALGRLYLGDPQFVDLLLHLYRLKNGDDTPRDLATQRFCRLCLLLHQRFSSRPDLLYGQFADPRFSHLHANALGPPLLPGHLYAQPEPFLQYVHQLWVKGLYQQLHLAYLAFQICGRSVPASDFHLRIFTVLGEVERLERIFTALYRSYQHTIPSSSLSNLLFIALGQEKLDQQHVNALVESLRISFPPQSIPPLPSSRPLSVSEKPLLAVVSADLRHHPVGRFWRPLVPALAQRFRLVHVFLNGTDGDQLTAELRAHSFDWLRLSQAEQPHLIQRLQQLAPQIALDLGGHTADNQHGWLHYRIAPVQATYLGFYGPTYARECDWWIVDRFLTPHIGQSYPGSERQWACPFPSLCYDVAAHGLPDPDRLPLSASEHGILGSFNHTRKLTRHTIQRFGAILQGLPQSTLMLRSHAFYDPAVRRWFLQKFVDAGASPSQLLPLPYAPTAAEAMADFSRIQLHLDAYPVSGTTTTLDALAMGVPVLTQPTALYAGAISAALLEAAGLPDGIVSSESDLLPAATRLLQHYRQPQQRRALARRIREGPLCAVDSMPQRFAVELGEMLKLATQACAA